MILFRLMNKGKVVGYEKHEDGRTWRTICLTSAGARVSGVVWCLLDDRSEHTPLAFYIPHDRKDRYIGVDYKAGGKVFENDKIITVVDGDEYSEHTIVYRDDIDYPAFDLSPAIDCDCNAIQYHTLEGELKYTGIEGVTTQGAEK